MDPSMNREAKLDMLIDTFSKLMHLLDRKGEKHKVQVGAIYSKKPTLFPLEEQTQSLQDKKNKQNMHDEKDCKEESEEGCQVGTSYFPTSCASLLREHYEQVANKNREECSKESINHLEITKSEMEEESKPLGSLPLCFKSPYFERKFAS